MANKIQCPYCGNNPVPHFTHWYFESINVLFTPLRQGILYNPASRLLKKLSLRYNFGLRAVDFFYKFGVISYQDNIDVCKVTRAGVLWEDAQKRGIIMRELLLFGKPLDLYVAEKSEIKKLFSGLPRPTDYDDSSLDKMDDKLELKQRLLQAGLPVPKGGSAFTFWQAKKIFNSVQKPVIVKPRAGSRGRHTNTYIYTEADLKRAFKIAKKLCAWVIVEEHLVGPVYRGTVVDYKTVGVNRGEVPQVVGDGISTIANLVAEKNKIPRPGVGDIILDDRSRDFLARQRLNFESIPEAGKTIYLLEKIGISRGGSSSEDFEICHPDNLLMFEQAARAAGDPIVGFDFIIPDITKSYKNQRCGFIEANTLPFIDLHHHPLLGTPRNVASAVWELVGM